MERGIDGTRPSAGGGASRPSGLYLHLPWCRIKCGYCDFYSLPTDDDALVERTGRALLADAGRVLAAEPGTGLDSVYVGGGTPSLLPAGFYRQLLDPRSATGERLRPGAEVTVEMNPETVRPGWLPALAEAGVTRASLGLQSFAPERLAFLERVHSAGTARRVAREVREAGIPGLGLDLIYQLPGQTPTELERELDQLLELEPDHVSAYGLGWEPGTRLEARWKRGEAAPLDPDLAAELYLALSERLRGAGYLHYEVSNFARPGAAGRHNSRYWQGGETLAAGPGAVGNRALDDDEAGRPHRPRRWKRAADWRAWLAAVEAQGDPPQSVDDPDEEGRLLERIFLGLRWSGGLSLDGLRAEFGAARCETVLKRAAREPLASAFERGRAQQATLERLFGRPMPAPAGRTLRLAPQDWLLLDECVVELCR